MRCSDSTVIIWHRWSVQSMVDAPMSPLAAESDARVTGPPMGGVRSTVIGAMELP